ncbi:hypothetical protein M5E84_13095 [[Ruminococcus] torques]|nr:hypothetical protein M5E84_13095 [[Ruminococcus] torques]
MSKELTTEQELMQATQYGLLIYAGQQKIHDEDERLKLEKIANEIGEYWGLEESVAGYPNFLRKLHSRGFADMLAKCNIRMEKQSGNESKKYWIWCMR